MAPIEHGILAPANDAKRAEIIDLLTTAYWMEMETVMSYTANSTNPDGIRAQEVIDSLKADITEELGHAQQFAQRIKDLGGTVPGSKAFVATQDELQPPADKRDIISVIKGVIAAEEGAIDHYNKIIGETDEDPVTQDMVTTILADEEGHRRQFVGFLTEYEA